MLKGRMALTGREGALKIKGECEFFDEIDEHLGHRDAVDVTNMHLESSLPYLEDEKQVGDKLKRKAENQPKKKEREKENKFYRHVSGNVRISKNRPRRQQKSATGVYGDYGKNDIDDTLWT